GYYPRSTTIMQDHAALRVEAEQIVDAGAKDERLAEIDRLEAGANLRNSMLGRAGAWVEPLVQPLGWDWRIGTAAIASFPAREVVIATLGTIYNLGGDTDESSSVLREKLKSATYPDGRLVFSLPVALSIMVFFALCCQCAATLAVIKRETRQWRWAVFTFVYMTGLAYVASLVTYQAASRIIG
ncbi:MAG: nucleoside recognition domain-containing protein, partial [Phycisphaerae bacterium]